MEPARNVKGVSVLVVGYTTAPKNISPFVLFNASVDITELECSPLSFSSKGPILPVKGYGHKRDMEFDYKVFDLMPNRDSFAKFQGPGIAFGSRPLSYGLHDCKWVDTGQVSDSFDIQQYHHIKLLRKELLVICCYLSNWVDTGQELPDVSSCALLFIDPLSSSLNDHTLFDKISKRSRCVAMLYNCEYIGEVEMFIECSDNLASFCNYYKLLCDKMASAIILPLLRELHSSEQVELVLPLLLPFEIECKTGIFSRQLNLEVVTSHPVRILEWTGCGDYIEGWTLFSLQLQEAEGILTLTGQIEGLSISFVGIPGSSHPVPAVHNFLHKEPHVAADIVHHMFLYNYHSHERRDDYYLCWWIGKDSIEEDQITDARLASTMCNSLKRRPVLG